MKHEYTTKQGYVADRLREMVVSGELRPGTRLRQQELADQFEVSPTPVREAIRQLETEGYLTSTPHVGVQVADVRRDGPAEVYEIRRLLEGRLAAEAAVRASEADVAWLRRAAAEFDEAVAKNDTVEARRINYRFHRRIWELADHHLTLEIVNSLWAKFPWDLLDYVPGRGERSRHEHEALVDAIAAHDPAGAEAALASHIASGQKDFLASADLNGEAP